MISLFEHSQCFQKIILNIPCKVTRGFDLHECLDKRYGAVSDTNVGVDMNEVDNLKRTMNAPFVELVGFDRVNEQQSDFSKLRAVDLSQTDLRYIIT